jgi:hypothetical protein
MAVLMKLEVPGGTTAQYDRTNEILGIGGEQDAPSGLLSHTCGETGDGIVVLDVWESVEALDGFFHDRLGAALEESGTPSATPDVKPVHNLIHGAGAEPNTIVLIEMAGLTVESYDRLIAQMPAHVGDGSAHPAVLHVAAVGTSNDISVFDLWDSPEAFGAFAQGQVGPAMGDDPPPIEPRFIPVYNHFTGPAN